METNQWTNKPTKTQSNVQHTSTQPQLFQQLLANRNEQPTPTHIATYSQSTNQTYAIQPDKLKSIPIYDTNQSNSNRQFMSHKHFNMDEHRDQHDPIVNEILSNQCPTYLRVLSPMVRYSKLPFRLLCRQYGFDVAFTPMILVDSFLRSEHARNSEFTTNQSDQPLIVQFATNNGIELAAAAQYVEGNNEIYISTFIQLQLRWFTFQLKFKFSNSLLLLLVLIGYASGIDLNCGCK
jgi:hypothetical protein